MSAMKGFGAVVGAATLVALGVGGTVAATLEVPSAEQVAIQYSDQAPRMLIDDPGNQLTAADRDRLERDAAQFTYPDTVETLHFLVFDTSRDNFNDTVLEYLQDNYPDEVDTDVYSDGVLIFAVDPNAREIGAYGGEDVDAQIKLRDRVDTILEAMRPGMRDNNIPGGLIAGLREATNPEVVDTYLLDSARGDRLAAALGAGAGSGGAVLAGGGLWVAARNRRKAAIEKARNQYELITREYTELSGRLDSIDIRANSLTSAFADNEMRRDWAEVRGRFLALHETVSGPGGVGSIDPSNDTQLYDHRDMLESASRVTTQVSNAEDNINRLFAVENGDAATRRSELTELRRDITRAVLDVEDPQLRARLSDLEARVDTLDRNPGAPGFLDDFVRLLDDHRVIMQAVKDRQFSDVKEHNALERPRIYDATYTYPNYVPFIALSSWHSSNVQAEQQAQASSGTNTSYSSGFSGAGGSGGY
ncbi:DUF5129 domain-containing protein [Corynebacterium sp. LK2510]|uniref:DUF5129 domain-containing protein n=1 Tax=Corynebacterium sp. LK2510 TaxID=3110472 RepID=UPI0034CF9C5A